MVSAGLAPSILETIDGVSGSDRRRDSQVFTISRELRSRSIDSVTKSLQSSDAIALRYERLRILLCKSSSTSDVGELRTDLSQCEVIDRSEIGGVLPLYTRLLFEVPSMVEF